MRKGGGGLRRVVRPKQPTTGDPLGHRRPLSIWSGGWHCHPWDRSDKRGSPDATISGALSFKGTYAASHLATGVPITVAKGIIGETTTNNDLRKGTPLGKE